ncbi:helix-turn-helix domain-containing protein [Comamonas thiooxydans]|uniref:helix-turn-helix domain-containing protein n=1 Tax=Comamonas thiooxydans TaxID=363952 RepID=UPI0001BB1829|nr:helix-turn-helix transcriptional regulator [Comamonas thiooxydans]ACY32683.1 transcriptional regulator, XRE family [Comamonas thiooxydans]MDO1476319.1 helix-turn-helix transcriptional regulator [Comamonas thiooxydans]
MRHKRSASQYKLGTFVPNIATRLKEVREQLGLSQQALAERCGVSARSQRNYESGERLPDAAYLAELQQLGIDLDYVLTGHRTPSVPALDAKERDLIDSYRRCEPEAKAILVQTAVLLSADSAPATVKKLEGKTATQRDV